MISVEKLVKRYGDVIALDHFSFHAKKNEIVGLLGPNGCGKTTAINCMLSLLKFDQGDVELFGEPVNPNNNDIKRRIGIVPQEIAIFEKLTVIENVDFFCGLYVKDKKEREELVAEAISFVGLDKYKKYVPKQLSGGLKRRLNIACGIAHKPDILFLDEPTVAVDAQSRNFILDWVKKMKESGTTVVYTTHYLEEAEDLCDTFVIMDNGRNIASGTLDDLQKSISTTESITIKFITDYDTLSQDLYTIPNVNQVIRNKDSYNIQFDKHSNNMTKLIEFVEKNALSYSEIRSEQPSLSNIFLELTGKELRD